MIKNLRKQKSHLVLVKRKQQIHIDPIDLVPLNICLNISFVDGNWKYFGFQTRLVLIIAYKSLLVGVMFKHFGWMPRYEIPVSVSYVFSLFFWFPLWYCTRNPLKNNFGSQVLVIHCDTIPFQDWYSFTSFMFWLVFCFLFIFIQLETLL